MTSCSTFTAHTWRSLPCGKRMQYHIQKPQLEWYRVECIPLPKPNHRIYLYQIVLPVQDSGIILGEINGDVEKLPISQC